MFSPDFPVQQGPAIKPQATADRALPFFLFLTNQTLLTRLSSLPKESQVSGLKPQVDSEGLLKNKNLEEDEFTDEETRR